MLCHMFFGMCHALADVTANLWQMCHACCNHQADGIACIVKQGGRCNCRVLLCVADVMQPIIHVAIDVWQMLMPGGRWNGHWIIFI